MFIEASINENYIKTLNLGCYPKAVLSFQESQDFFQHLIFIDYQLQLLIQNEFNGLELLPAKAFEVEGNESPREKLRQLISYAHSITANYNDLNKTYEEVFYYTVVLGQLYYLNSEFNEMHKTLSLFKPADSSSINNIHHREFVEYLNVRYNVLLGLTNVDNSHKLWIEYLFFYSKHFDKSSIAANHWIDILLNKVTSQITKGGEIPITFKDLKSQKFGDNKNTITSFSNFLLRPDNKRFISKTFKDDYTYYLSNEIETRIKSKSEFPDASQKYSEENDFINTLYESLSHVTHNTKILSPTLSKKFLISMTSKTYQSQVVLSNYIKTLIELNEYDEAYAAFKTYVSYVDKDQEQNNGRINNLLSIIDTYSTSILNFNPINSFIPRTKSPKKFKYTSSNTVLESLSLFVNQLKVYLIELTKLADLSYDEELEEFADNHLSFLYHKYNVNVLLNDNSEFIRLISKAWFALGQYYRYLSTYNSSSLEDLNINTLNVLKNFKKSLIVNSTGNSTYLFNYALALSYNRHLKASIKLCKFILKKYPESFKTWNLLVLLLTSFETYNPEFVKNKTPNNNKNGKLLNGTKSPVKYMNGENKSSTQNLKELEKFINNALNIAGIFIVNHRKAAIKLTVETKFEILQLKLTQLAVWEQIYGVAYILDYLQEVFILYHELFDEVVIEQPRSVETAPSILTNDYNYKPDGRWSHRPSFIDPKPLSTNESKKLILREKQIAKDKIKNISKAQQLVPNSPQSNKNVVDEKTDPLKIRLQILEKKILQEVWLWTSRIYLKIELLEESEQCIVESESIFEPNIKTFTHLGLLTSKNRKFLSLQELEKSLDDLALPENQYRKKDYGITLLGLCKLFIIDDNFDNSLFISSKDLNAGLIRLKILLEQFSRSWPYGFNNSELWYYLSIIYEKIDDKILLTNSLWKCIELEDFRPVRSFEVCEEFNYY